MGIRYYRAFGLTIGSEIPLPELIEAGVEEPDVQVRFSALDSYKPAGRLTPGGWWIKDQETYFSHDQVGALLVRQGKTILVDPKPGTDPALMRLFLFGNALGILMTQRGYLVLHGSAVSHSGGAVAFLGHSGEGKSTMAAALNPECPLVSDDVLAIRAHESPPLLYPAFPRIKLSPEPVDVLDFSSKAETNSQTVDGKAAIIATTGFSTDPLPLKKIFILERGKSLSLEPVGRQEAVIELVRYTYTRSFVNLGIQRESHFRDCARIALAVPVFRLFRPKNLSRLSECARKVSEELPA